MVLLVRVGLLHATLTLEITTMTDDKIALRELLEKGSDTTLLREMIGFAAQRLMDLDPTPCAAPVTASAARAEPTFATAIATATGRPGPELSNAASRSCAAAATSPASWNHDEWPRRR